MRTPHIPLLPADRRRSRRAQSTVISRPCAPPRITTAVSIAIIAPSSPARCSPWPAAPIGWQKSVPAGRPESPGAARSTQHAEPPIAGKLASTGASKRPILSLRSAQRSQSAHSPANAPSPLDVPFYEASLGRTYPPRPSVPSFVQGHVHGGGITQYASPSALRGSASRSSVTASSKALDSGLDRHSVFHCLSNPVPVPVGSCCRPVAGSTKAPACELPRSWPLFSRSI